MANPPPPTNMFGQNISANPGGSLGITSNPFTGPPNTAGNNPNKNIFGNAAPTAGTAPTGANWLNNATTGIGGGNNATLANPTGAGGATTGTVTGPAANLFSNTGNATIFSAANNSTTTPSANPPVTSPGLPSFGTTAPATGTSTTANLFGGAATGANSMTGKPSGATGTTGTTGKTGAGGATGATGTTGTTSFPGFGGTAGTTATTGTTGAPGFGATTGATATTGTGGLSFGAGTLGMGTGAGTTAGTGTNTAGTGTGLGAGFGAGLGAGTGASLFGATAPSAPSTGLNVGGPPAVAPSAPTTNLSAPAAGAATDLKSDSEAELVKVNITLGEMISIWKQNLLSHAQTLEREMQFALELEKEKNVINELWEGMSSISSDVEGGESSFNNMLNSIEYRQKNLLAKLKGIGRGGSTMGGTVSSLESFYEALNHSVETVREFDQRIEQSMSNEYVDKIFETLQMVEKEVLSMDSQITQLERGMSYR